MKILCVPFECHASEWVCVFIDRYPPFSFSFYSANFFYAAFVLVTCTYTSVSCREKKIYVRALWNFLNLKRVKIFSRKWATHTNVCQMIYFSLHLARFKKVAYIYVDFLLARGPMFSSTTVPFCVQSSISFANARNCHNCFVVSILFL